MMIMPLVIQVIKDEDDRQFMEQLYTDYNRLMYSTTWKYAVSGIDVEDVVSDSCVALIPKIPQLRTMEPKMLRAYIITTVRNVTIDANRKIRRYHEKHQYDDLDVLENMPGKETTEDRVLMREKLRVILAVAAELTLIEQDVLRMKCQQGMTARQIADLTGITEDDVWKYLKHARLMIRQAV